VKLSFFPWDLIWRKTTCWGGFDQDIIKALQKARCWAWFDHEVVLRVLEEEAWFQGLTCI
jgi:hypothetical protein